MQTCYVLNLEPCKRLPTAFNQYTKAPGFWHFDLELKGSLTACHHSINTPPRSEPLAFPGAKTTRDWSASSHSLDHHIPGIHSLTHYTTLPTQPPTLQKWSPHRQHPLLRARARARHLHTRTKPHPRKQTLSNKTRRLSKARQASNSNSLKHPPPPPQLQLHRPPIPFLPLILTPLLTVTWQTSLCKVFRQISCCPCLAPTATC